MYFQPFVLSALFVGRQFTTHKRLISKTTLNMYPSPMNPKACADVYLVPMFSDNYGFILVDRFVKIFETVFIPLSIFYPDQDILKSIYAVIM